jgi:ribosomal protein S18 acetylase RimI-like enzyme
MNYQFILFVLTISFLSIYLWSNYTQTPNSSSQDNIVTDEQLQEEYHKQYLRQQQLEYEEQQRFLMMQQKQLLLEQQQSNEHANTLVYDSKKYSDLTPTELVEVLDLWKVFFKDINSQSVPFHENTMLCICRVQGTGQIVGYIGILDSYDLMCYFSANNIKNPETYGVKNWKGSYLFNFGVKPEYRNKKIGKTLLDMAIKLATNNKKEYMHLIVEATNQIAINMYKKIGFTVDEENYTGSHDKMLTMHLSLENKEPELILKMPMAGQNISRSRPLN